MKDNYPTGDLSRLDQEHHRWAISRSSQGIGQQIKGFAFTDLLTERGRIREVKELIIQKHDPVPGGETRARRKLTSRSTTTSNPNFMGQ